jgi:hypothetical protein
MSKSLQRSIAIGAFAIFGSALAFAAGARLGSSLDHHTRSVSVARVPVQDLQVAPVKDEPVMPIANR